MEVAVQVKDCSLELEASKDITSDVCTREIKKKSFI